jgi:hypothetical protein
MVDLTRDLLLDELPHGSGINGDWIISETKDRFIATNFYDTMNENGFYDVAVDFQLTIPKKNPMDFRLKFIGSRAQYYVKKYMLRDYLEETFANAIEDIIKR